MGSKILAYLPAVAWAAFLLYLGGRDFADVPGYDLPIDKLAHLVLYGVLGGLAAVGWRTSGRKPHFLIPLVAALTVGAVDELHQGTVPARTADWADWGVDVASVALVFGVAANVRWGRMEGKRP